jgi:hypothetical protein
VNLSGADSAQASFTAPALAWTLSTTLTFELTVTDTSGARVTDSVSVVVYSATYDGDADRLPDSWEILHFGIAAGTGADDPDGDGLSNAQEYAEGTDPTMAEPPPAAVGHVAGIAGDASAAIVWDKTRSAAAYHLYWSTLPGVTKTTGTKVANVTNPFVHTGLIDNKTYYYIVTAANNSGESAPSAEVAVRPAAQSWGLPQKVPGAAPNARMAADLRGEAVVLWSEPAGVGYTLRSLQFTPGIGWGADTAISSATWDYLDLRIDMDEAGNAIAVWRQSDGVRYNLWASYYAAQTDSWGPPELVEHYDGDGYTEGSVYEVSEVRFLAEGQAIVSYTQKMPNWYANSGEGLLTHNTYIATYAPGRGWSSQRGEGPTGLAYYSVRPRLSVNGVGQAMII